MQNKDDFLNVPGSQKPWSNTGNFFCERHECGFFTCTLSAFSWKHKHHVTYCEHTHTQNTLFRGFVQRFQTLLKNRLQIFDFLDNIWIFESELIWQHWTAWKNLVLALPLGHTKLLSDLAYVEQAVILYQCCVIIENFFIHKIDVFWLFWIKLAILLNYLAGNIAEGVFFVATSHETCCGLDSHMWRLCDSELGFTQSYYIEFLCSLMCCIVAVFE